MTVLPLPLLAARDLSRATWCPSGLALLACLMLGGCGGESTAADSETVDDGPAPVARRDVNVLILSVDTLRADRMGCYGNDMWGESPSPAMDALAARGVTFERSTVPRGQTRPSIAALFTGKYPITTGLRENGYALFEEHRTFLERLQAGGHRTGSFVANFRKAGIGSNWVYRGADVWQEGQDGARMAALKEELLAGGMPPGEVVGMVESTLQVEWDDRVEEAALAFLDSHDADEPFTAYVHFYDVHKPYNPPEGFDRFGHYDGMPPALADGSARGAHAVHEHLDQITLTGRQLQTPELNRILGLYDGTVMATDARIGRILERLEARGLDERTVVVLTSDHGEELYDRNAYFYHGNSIYDGVLRVPLVIAGPGLPAGARIGSPVQNLDVTATVLDVTGLPIPDDCEGVSLLPLIRGEVDTGPRRYAYFEWQDIVYAISDGRHTYLSNPKGAHLRKPPFYGTELAYPIECYEGYDLSTDPRQARNLLAGKDPKLIRGADDLPAVLGGLSRQLDAWLAAPIHEKEMSRPGMDPAHAKQMEQQLEMLRQLGYVGPTAYDRVYMGGCDDG